MTFPVAIKLLHYWWPVVLGWSLTVVVHRVTERSIDADGLALLLCGIGAAYSLDRIPDAATAGAVWLRRVLWLTGATAAVVCAWLLLRVPVHVALLAVAMGCATLSYPVLKRVPFSKTVIVSVVWTWSVIVLPFHDVSWFVGRWLLVPEAIPLLALMASGCLLCDLNDIPSDRASRVHSVPVLLGGGTAVRIAGALAAVAIVSALGLHRPGLAIGGACLGLLGSFPSLLAHESVGPLSVDVALTLPGVLIAAHLV